MVVQLVEYIILHTRNWKTADVMWCMLLEQLYVHCVVESDSDGGVGYYAINPICTTTPPKFTFTGIGCYT
jgi:hypothetical protein